MHSTHHPPSITHNLAVLYSFSAKERYVETGLAYFGARYYSSDLSIWLSVDTMSDKYPSLSPYVYCTDNPVRLVDPDGREKIDAMGNNPKNRRHKQMCKRYKDNEPVIHLWAHGNPKRIETYNPISNEPEFVMKASNMRDFLCSHSAIYQENDENIKTSILVLHSCNTGQGENNIAQQISAELDLLVVAPNAEVWGQTENEGTPQEFCYEIGVNHLYQKAGYDKKYVGKRGAWIIYYKGVQVGSFDGHSKPYFRDPQQIINKYEKEYQKIISENY